MFVHYGTVKVCESDGGRGQKRRIAKVHPTVTLYLLHDKECLCFFLLFPFSISVFSSYFCHHFIIPSSGTEVISLLVLLPVGLPSFLCFCSLSASNLCFVQCSGPLSCVHMSASSFFCFRATGFYPPLVYLHLHFVVPLFRQANASINALVFCFESLPEMGLVRLKPKALKHLLKGIVDDVL